MSRHVDPFIALSSGGKFYPLGPDPERINLVDIAHSLSHQCRYAGHTSELWSVALHSLEVSHRVEQHPWLSSWNFGDRRAAALTGLLHDASEAYLQDIVRPIKPLVHGYYLWEENVERAIARRFCLPHPWPDVVKVVDDAIAADEVAQFFPPGSEAWRRYGITEARSGLRVLEPKETKRAFLARFTELGGAYASQG